MLRSKNAGPFNLTFDIIFHNQESYLKVVNSYIISQDKIAELYGCDPEQVQIYEYEKVSSIKISIPRRYPSGDIHDTDVFGAQQHVPLMNLEI
ncbi:hypothetical protein ABID53_004256 [Bacillus oleivorans]